jgi:hypothetical protein
MIVSINQPAYLPWAGYFDRIFKSDIHVVLDCVQFEKGSYINRNRILSKNGPTLLTIPLLHQSLHDDIVSKKINNKISWQRKHISTMKQNYSKSPYYMEYVDKMQYYYDNKFDYLGEVLRGMTELFLRELNIKTPLLYSSEMNISGEKGDLILNICKSLGASTYISGPFGRGYLNENLFRKEGINILYHNFKSPIYTQMVDPYYPNLSVIDLMFNCGPKSLSKITSLSLLEANE